MKNKCQIPSRFNECFTPSELDSLNLALEMHQVHVVNMLITPNSLALEIKDFALPYAFLTAVHYVGRWQLFSVAPYSSSRVLLIFYPRD